MDLRIFAPSARPPAKSNARHKQGRGSTTPRRCGSTTAGGLWFRTPNSGLELLRRLYPASPVLRERDPPEGQSFRVYFSDPRRDRCRRAPPRRGPQGTACAAPQPCFLPSGEPPRFSSLPKSIPRTTGSTAALPAGTVQPEGVPAKSSHAAPTTIRTASDDQRTDDVRRQVHQPRAYQEQDREPRGDQQGVERQERLS